MSPLSGPKAAFGDVSVGLSDEVVHAAPAPSVSVVQPAGSAGAVTPSKPSVHIGANIAAEEVNVPVPALSKTTAIDAHTRAGRPDTEFDRTRSRRRRMGANKIPWTASIRRGGSDDDDPRSTIDTAPFGVRIRPTRARRVTSDVSGRAVAQSTPCGARVIGGSGKPRAAGHRPRRSRECQPDGSKRPWSGLFALDAACYLNRRGLRQLTPEAAVFHAMVLT